MCWGVAARVLGFCCRAVALVLVIAPEEDCSLSSDFHVLCLRVSGKCRCSLWRTWCRLGHRMWYSNSPCRSCLIGHTLQTEKSSLQIKIHENHRYTAIQKGEPGYKSLFTTKQPHYNLQTSNPTVWVVDVEHLTKKQLKYLIFELLEGLIWFFPQR